MKTSKANAEFIKRLSETHAHERIQQVLEDLKIFLDALTSEGTPVLTKNMKALRVISEKTGSLVLDRLEMEENVLFPYAQMHVPKLEMVTGILESEHENVRRALKDLKCALWESAAGPLIKSVNHLQKIKVKGYYLIYIVRDLLVKKEKSFYHVLNNELDEEEKKEFGALLKEWKNLRTMQGKPGESNSGKVG